MLRLPARLQMQLVDASATPLHQPDVLVAVNFLANGHYYYGNLIGLTNETGVASIDGGQLAARYAADQKRYPADYKLGLLDCDEMIEVALLSGEEIRRSLEAVRRDSSISDDIRQCYMRALNAEFAPVLLRVSADAAVGRALLVYLPTKRL